MPKINTKDYGDLCILIAHAYDKNREFQEAVEKLSKWFAPRLRGETMSSLALPPGAEAAVAWLLSSSNVPEPPNPQLDDMMLGPRS